MDKENKIICGWWGKYKIINGKAKKIYIGPMTKAEMLDYDDTYRHNFANKRPKNA